MQFGSVQAKTTVAISITNKNLGMIIIITKINPHNHLSSTKNVIPSSLCLPILSLQINNNSKYCRMSCIHFSSIPQPAFLSTLTSKVYWTCLYDGCTKSKKNMLRSELWQLCGRLNDEHKVMINCETFQIFCTECKIEILDTPEEEIKAKKGKFKNPRMIRELIIGNNLTEDILFAGNAQYPPSFQRQRRGLCGLKANSLNSYLNATLQLLAAVPIIAQMSTLTDPLKVQSRFLRAMLRVIETIWSGKFRITSAQEVERQLLLENSNFQSYRFKTPQHLLYFIVKKMIEEMHYPQVSCMSAQTDLPPFHQWSQTQEQRQYSFTREVLAGECVLECVCGSCGRKQFAENRFECLKVSGQGGQVSLCHLIQECFDWRNNHAQAIKRIEEGRLRCEFCNEGIKQYFAYVRLPNHLVLQLGDDLEGFDCSLPEQLDLLNFTQEHVKKEKEGEAIYQYVGSVYRKDRRFCTHMRHAHNKKEFTICDQLITEGPRSYEHVKLAIYQRGPNHKHQPLLRNILSCLQVNINPIVPLPDYWSLYLKYNHNVQPLVNPYICTHGRLKHNLPVSKIKEGPQRLPVQVYQYLVQTFGGRKIDLKVGEECQECGETQAKIAQIRSSQRQMASFADKLSHKKERVLINRSWLESWKLFAYDHSKRGYRVFGHIRPGPIKNGTQNIEQDLKSGALKKISPQVWFFLHKFYGGGPLISNSDIHPNVVLTAAVNLRFDSIGPMIMDLYSPPSTKQNEAQQKEVKKRDNNEKQQTNVEIKNKRQ